MKKFASLWLPVISWMAVIFAGSAIANIPTVGGQMIDGAIHRAVHLTEYAVLGALVLRAVTYGKRIARRQILITLIVVGLYGASDELHQRFVAGRTSELLTVLWDLAGGAIGVWLWRRWCQRIDSESTNQQRMGNG